MGMVELGGWLALSWGVFGFLGNYFGGHWATKYLARQEKYQMYAIAGLQLLYGMLSIAVYLAPSKGAALSLLAVSAFVVSCTGGSTLAALQSLVSERMRAVTVAVLFLFGNLIGLGLGPLAIGIASDLLNPIAGQESLRYALALSCPGMLWVAFHFWQAAKTIENDIHAVEEDASRQNSHDGSTKLSKNQTVIVGGN